MLFCLQKLAHFVFLCVAVSEVSSLDADNANKDSSVDQCSVSLLQTRARAVRSVPESLTADDIADDQQHHSRTVLEAHTDKQEAESEPHALSDERKKEILDKYEAVRENVREFAERRWEEREKARKEELEAEHQKEKEEAKEGKVVKEVKGAEDTAKDEMFEDKAAKASKAAQEAKAAKGVKETKAQTKAEEEERVVRVGVSDAQQAIKDAAAEKARQASKAFAHQSDVKASERKNVVSVKMPAPAEIEQEHVPSVERHTIGAIAQRREVHALSRKDAKLQDEEHNLPFGIFARHGRIDLDENVSTSTRSSNASKALHKVVDKTTNTLKNQYGLINGAVQNSPILNQTKKNFAEQYKFVKKGVADKFSKVLDNVGPALDDARVRGAAMRENIEQNVNASVRTRNNSKFSSSHGTEADDIAQVRVSAEADSTPKFDEVQASLSAHQSVRTGDARRSSASGKSGTSSVPERVHPSTGSSKKVVEDKNVSTIGRLDPVLIRQKQRRANVEVDADDDDELDIDSLERDALNMRGATRDTEEEDGEESDMVLAKAKAGAKDALDNTVNKIMEHAEAKAQKVVSSTAQSTKSSAATKGASLHKIKDTKLSADQAQTAKDSLKILRKEKVDSEEEVSRAEAKKGNPFDAEVKANPAQIERLSNETRSAREGREEARVRDAAAHPNATKADTTVKHGDPSVATKQRLAHPHAEVKSEPGKSEHKVQVPQSGLVRTSGMEQKERPSVTSHEGVITNAETPLTHMVETTKKSDSAHGKEKIQAIVGRDAEKHSQEKHQDREELADGGAEAAGEAAGEDESVSGDDAMETREDEDEEDDGVVEERAVEEEDADMARREPDVSDDSGAPVDEAPGETEEDDSLCDPGRSLDFTAATVSNNNLGNVGPDVGDTSLVYQGVASLHGTQVDLVITTTSPYVPRDMTKNGLKGPFGVVNIQTDTSVDLSLSFVAHETGEQVVMPPFHFTFFDLDQGMAHGSREQVTINGFDSYEVSDETQLTVETIDEHSATFISKQRGGKLDNPTHPTSLTRLQKERTVTAKMPATSQFSVTLADIGYADTQGRNFFFSGSSQLVCERDHKCADYECPDGFELRTMAEFLLCSGRTCDERDRDVCCFRSEADEHDGVAAMG